MSKFTAKSTASEVLDGKNLSGYNVIITGATDGIGLETARVLAKAGARVTIGARNIEKAEAVVNKLKKETGNQDIEAGKLEMSSIKSVKQFVSSYIDSKRPLDILINNAGITANEKKYSEDGFELSFATNYLGHFALTVGLLPVMVETAKSTGRKARVITLSSDSHATVDIDLDDINYDKRPFERWEVYGASKTGNVFMTLMVAKLYADQGILAYSVHPGFIRTNIIDQINKEDLIAVKVLDEQGNFHPSSKSVEQGASTTIWAAISDDPELLSRNGAYCEDNHVSNTRYDEETFTGYADHTYDHVKAEKLWNLSLKWIETKN